MNSKKVTRCYLTRHFIVREFSKITINVKWYIDDFWNFVTRVSFSYHLFISSRIAKTHLLVENFASRTVNLSVSHISLWALELFCKIFRRPPLINGFNSSALTRISHKFRHFDLDSAVWLVGHIWIHRIGRKIFKVYLAFLGDRSGGMIGDIGGLAKKIDQFIWYQLDANLTVREDEQSFWQDNLRLVVRQETFEPNSFSTCHTYSNILGITTWLSKSYLLLGTPGRC